MSGTTVGLALVYNQQLFIANVGDTRIVLAKQNGQGVALTV
jgi:serine/threonine protein phosphatase PrpC